MKKIIIALLVLTFVAGICGAIMVSAQTKVIKVNNESTATLAKKKPIVKKTKTISSAPAALASTALPVTPTITPQSPSTTASKVKDSTKPTVSSTVKATPTVKKTVAKTTTKTTAVKTSSGVSWASSGLTAVRKIPSGVRPAYMRKVESYAKRNGIRLITASVVAGMRE